MYPLISHEKKAHYSNPSSVENLISKDANSNTVEKNIDNIVKYQISSKDNIMEESQENEKYDDIWKCSKCDQLVEGAINDHICK